MIINCVQSFSFATPHLLISSGSDMSYTSESSTITTSESVVSTSSVYSAVSSLTPHSLSSYQFSVSSAVRKQQPGQ